MNAQNDNSNQQLQRKQCHGNRKDQRFRKKYRAQGMKSENIEKKLARGKQIEMKKIHPRTITNIQLILRQILINAKERYSYKN